VEEKTFKPLDTFKKGIEDFIDSIGNILKTGDLFQKEIGQTGISLGYVIAQSFDAAKDAMASFSEAKKETIQKEKQDHLDALERERDRVLARAESAAQEDTINRQFDQRKRQIEKEAGEKLKKQKLAELRIALLTEIANIAAAAAGNPANAATFGLAGIAQFGLLSGFALVRYAINAAAIRKQQFAGGGKVERMKNGRITARPNIPLQSNGDSILATLQPDEVVLNKRQQHALGGPSVFKRIGVPGFAGGGRITGPQLGTGLRPPSFNNGFYSAGVNGMMQQQSDMDELKQMVSEVAAAVYASDVKPVILNPQKVTEAQSRKKKDVGIGSI
jgi:hypothetical protein